MPGWTANSRHSGQIPQKPRIVDDERSTPKLKAQFEAAQIAAKRLDKEIEGDVVVALSGFASKKGDTEPDQIHVHVVRADVA